MIALSTTVSISNSFSRRIFKSGEIWILYAYDEPNRPQKVNRDKKYDKNKRQRSYRKKWESDFKCLAYDDN